MAEVLVPLAEGFEELEAVTVIDLLRRGGIEVSVAGRQTQVTGSHGITLSVDVPLSDALQRDWDMVVLPGGQPGSDNLEADAELADLLRRLADSGRFTAAICAAPKVFAAAGLLEGRKVTSFPGVLDSYAVPGMEHTGEPVVQDGKLVTSRGPGTAMDFALALIETLAGRERRDAVESRLQRPATTRAET